MKMQKRKFRIGELANKLELERFVVRFWEKEVAQSFGTGHLFTRDGIGKKECFEKHILNY